MLKFSCISCALLLLVLQASATHVADAKFTKNVSVKLATGKNFDKLLALYPNAVELQRKLVHQQLAAGIEPRVVITYFMGNRVSGDHLVGFQSESVTWSALHDVRLNINYPSAGTGSIVSYIEIPVSQSSTSGRAYITSGGIGQRHVTIVVEAEDTYYFSYSASVYGY